MASRISVRSSIKITVSIGTASLPDATCLPAAGALKRGARVRGRGRDERKHFHTFGSSNRAGPDENNAARYRFRALAALAEMSREQHYEQRNRRGQRLQEPDAPVRGSAAIKT